MISFSYRGNVNELTRELVLYSQLTIFKETGKLAFREIKKRKTEQQQQVEIEDNSKRKK